MVIRRDHGNAISRQRVLYVYSRNGCTVCILLLTYYLAYKKQYVVLISRHHSALSRIQNRIFQGSSSDDVSVCMLTNVVRIGSRTSQRIAGTVSLTLGS